MIGLFCSVQVSDETNDAKMKFFCLILLIVAAHAVNEDPRAGAKVRVII